MDAVERVLTSRHNRLRRRGDWALILQAGGVEKIDVVSRRGLLPLIQAVCITVPAWTADFDLS